MLGLLQDKIRSFIPNSGPRNALKVMNIKERKSPSPSKKKKKKTEKDRKNYTTYEIQWPSFTHNYTYNTKEIIPVCHVFLYW